MLVQASAAVQCRASSSSVTVKTSPPVPDMSLVFLHSLIQSSMPQPGPKLTRLWLFLPAGSDIALLRAAGEGFVAWRLLRQRPGVVSACLGFIDGGIGRDWGKKEPLVLERALVAPEEASIDVIDEEEELLFLSWFLLVDSWVSGDIGGGSVTMVGGGSLMAGNGTLTTSMIALVIARITGVKSLDCSTFILLDHSLIV